MDYRELIPIERDDLRECAEMMLHALEKEEARGRVSSDYLGKVREIKGRDVYRRLDTRQGVGYGQVRVLNHPPFLLRSGIDYDRASGRLLHDIEKRPSGANAYLLGGTHETAEMGGSLSGLEICRAAIFCVLEPSSRTGSLESVPRSIGSSAKSY
jgi:hypothetical protein